MPRRPRASSCQSVAGSAKTSQVSVISSPGRTSAGEAVNRVMEIGPEAVTGVEANGRVAVKAPDGRDVPTAAGVNVGSAVGRSPAVATPITAGMGVRSVGGICVAGRTGGDEVGAL